MTIEQVKQLHPGDEVFWNDPDDGECSRTYKIAGIVLRSWAEGVVHIIDEDGSELTCYARELA